MKKTFLLLFSIGSITTLFAQDNRNGKNFGRDIVPDRDDHQTVYNNASVRDDHHTVAYVDYRKRDEEIARVLADYNRRIDAVQHDRRLRGKEKTREVSRLQREKDQAIRSVNARYDTQRFDHRW